MSRDDNLDVDWHDVKEEVTSNTLSATGKAQLQAQRRALALCSSWLTRYKRRWLILSKCKSLQHYLPRPREKRDYYDPTR